MITSDGTIAWDKANKCYVGKLSLGYAGDGKTRKRPSVRGKTKAEAKDNLDKLRDEINADIRTPATYTIEQCVEDWLDSIERDDHTLATWRSQAKKWIYPKIGATKLKDFTATDADRFFRELAGSLGNRSLTMIKSTLRRSIRRAQIHNLIGRNVVELIDLPTGQPGHPSRAMTQEQAASVLKAASGKATGYVRVVKASKGRYGATHAATETGELSCGTKPHRNATLTEVSREIKETTCRSCRSQLGIDDADDTNLRLKALFVLAITLGLGPGELRKLTWATWT